MKTIQLLIVIIFLSVSTFSTAQDASNDATWEETISFLKDFVPKFNHTDLYLPDETRSRNYSYEIENNTLISTENWRNGNKEVYKADLLELKEVYISKNSGDIVLRYTGKVVTGKSSWLSDSNKAAQFINLVSKNGDNGDYFKIIEYFSPIESENTQRLYKALQHLTYLAIEKRKSSKF
jgi:hypothetical protein